MHFANLDLTFCWNFTTPNPYPELNFLTEMTQEYELREEVDKFLFECAPQLGFFFTKKERLIYIISEGNQLDLETMEMIPVEDCLLVEDTGIGSGDIAIRYSLTHTQPQANQRKYVL